jgi:hypothetical protein
MRMALAAAQTAQPRGAVDGDAEIGNGNGDPGKGEERGEIQERKL